MTPEYKVITYKYPEKIPDWIFAVLLYATFPIYMMIVLPTVYHNMMTGYNFFYGEIGNDIVHYCVSEKDAKRILWYEKLMGCKAFISDLPNVW